MPAEHKTVFISYRRNVASFIARAIFLDLRVHHYDVFMDVESINAGQFDTIILNQIEARAHFVLILTPGTLDRCAEPGDWLRREIEYAIEKGRNVVPLFVNDFKYSADTNKFLTGGLAGLPRFNGLNVPHDFFDEAMARLRKRYLKQPVYGILKPAPDADQPAVQQKIEVVAAQPAPTPTELSAEQYFSRAYDRDEGGDLDGAIADLTEAIRLNPHYAEAYNNRGITRRMKGDLDGAIADYNQALRLDPKYADAYSNRGATYYTKGDFDSAITDCNEALRLNPQLKEAYINRGLARRRKGDLNGAIADCAEAIRLDPQDALVYNNRGIARDHEGDLDGAIADYTEAIHFDPRYANAYGNRGEAYFAREMFEKALEDFQQANRLRPAYNMTLGGLALTHFVLGQKAEAKRLWRTLLAQDQRYRDADWVGQELNWHPILVEAARKLIAEL